jgi:hypothetical protein
MRNNCNNSAIFKVLIWILSIGAVPAFASNAKADCVPNQSEVPACLSGTAVAPDYSGAVIQENGQAGLRQIMQGDIVAGWTVEEIGAGYVDLKRGTQTARLELPQTQPENVETVEPAADDVPRAVKRGPVRHTRSLARGGE